MRINKNAIRLKVGQNSISNPIVKSKYTQIISTSGIQEAFNDPNLVDDYFLKGGYKVVSDITCRDNIPCEYRKLGMQVMVIGPDTSFKRYILKGEDPCSNDNWEEATIENTEVGVKLVEDYSIFGNNLNNQRYLNLYFKNNLITLNLKLESIPIFNSNNYYNKTEINGFLSGKQNTIGYTPENSANKSDSYTESSSTTYASTKALVDGLSTKLDKGTYTGTASDLKNDIETKQKKLSSFDESILIETDGNIEGNVSLFTEYFQQQVCELNFIPIQILGVYKNGLKLLQSEYTITLPKTISINTYTDENIEIQYTHLKN